ncbi:MAG: hypothetical protein LBI71_06575 [Enterobacteriaceae bacterium]|jgi:hypothetical protein|nr:hypothetical protein [Enterobacteriaceae bacterium]
MKMILYRKEIKNKCRLDGKNLHVDDDIIFKCKCRENPSNIIITNSMIHENDYAKLESGSKIIVEFDFDPISFHQKRIIRAKLTGSFLKKNEKINLKSRLLEIEEYPSMIKSHDDYFKKVILDELLKKHRTSSSNSMFISFTSDRSYCKNNYLGHIFSLRLIEGVINPIKNNHVSGNEKEYLIIGNLKSSDIHEIKFCGSDKGLYSQSKDEILTIKNNEPFTLKWNYSSQRYL